MKALLIDDDDSGRQMVKTLLQFEGIEVVAFDSGAEGLKYLETETPDCVLLDLSMPVLDGLTVAEEIRRNETVHGKAPIPIAFLTAQNIDDAVLRIAEKTNVGRIFKKVVDIEKLGGELRQWLQS